MGLSAISNWIEPPAAPSIYSESLVERYTESLELQQVQKLVTQKHYFLPKVQREVPYRAELARQVAFLRYIYALLNCDAAKIRFVKNVQIFIMNIHFPLVAMRKNNDTQLCTSSKLRRSEHSVL